MVYYKKGNEIFAFEVEEDLKDFCADNDRDKISNYVKIKINIFDKRTKKFNKT